MRPRRAGTDAAAPFFVPTAISSLVPQPAEPSQQHTHATGQHHKTQSPPPPPLQAVSVVLEALLSLRGLRPTLEVRPVDHETFFVEEPPPVEEEEAVQLGPPLGQQEHAQLQQAQQAGPQLDGGEGPLVAAVAGGAGAASA